jgi:hypothetical protein
MYKFVEVSNENMRNKKGERIQKVIVCNGKRERERETG